MTIGLVYVHALRQGGYPRDIRCLLQNLARRIDVTLFTETGTRFEGLDEVVKVKSLTEIWKSAERLDLVHIAGLFIPRQMLLIRKLTAKQIPIIVSPLGHLMPLAMRVKRWRKETYLKVVSLWFKKSMLHVLGPAEEMSIRKYFNHNKSFMATLGVLPCPMTLRSQKVHEKKHPLQLIFLGRNDIYQKGIDVLLKGFALAVQSGAEVHLTIAGQPWNGSPRYIDNFLEKHRLKKQVTVIGPVKEEEKWHLLVEGHYLIYLSRWDGPPRPIREAISVGTPVIVSPETNIGYLVEEYVAGIQVALDPSAVSDAILHVASEPELRRSFSEGALKLRERLQWDHVALDYIKVYKSVLGIA